MIISLTTLLYRNKAEHLAVDIVGTGLLEFTTYMCGDSLDVSLQYIDIREYMMIDTLQHIIGRIGLRGTYHISIVDQTVSERLHTLNGTKGGKSRHYFIEVSHS